MTSGIWGLVIRRRGVKRLRLSGGWAAVSILESGGGAPSSGFCVLSSGRGAGAVGRIGRTGLILFSSALGQAGGGENGELRNSERGERLCDRFQGRRDIGDGIRG